MKKVVSTVAKKVASSSAKKTAEKPKKVMPPAKAKPVEAKKISKKPPLPAIKAKKEIKVDKKPAPPLKGKGKELLLEVPAPKGVAILGKEGKKKSKGPSEAALLASKKRCREPGCENDFSIGGYCRLHYIKNWRKIKRKEAIIASGQLNNYVEELVSKYPDKYLDVIRQDLASEKDWSKVVVDLELDSADEESGAEEDIDVVAEGVQRARGEFDDDSDAF